MKLSGFEQGDPSPSSSACRQSSRSRAPRRRSRPAPSIEYEVPDMYGRPWARIWEQYWEQGMERPRPDDIFDFN